MIPLIFNVNVFNVIVYDQQKAIYFPYGLFGVRISADVFTLSSDHDVTICDSVVWFYGSIFDQQHCEIW